MYDAATYFYNNNHNMPCKKYNCCINQLSSSNNAATIEKNHQPQQQEQYYHNPSVASWPNSNGATPATPRCTVSAALMFQIARVASGADGYCYQPFIWLIWRKIVIYVHSVGNICASCYIMVRFRETLRWSFHMNIIFSIYVGCN